MGEVVALDDAVGHGCLYASVGRARDFMGGWGMALFGMKPHHFARSDGVLSDAIYLTARCGMRREVEPDTYICEAGNFPKCKHCMAGLRRDSLAH